MASSEAQKGAAEELGIDDDMASKEASGKCLD